jgi:hypothetical protein
MHIRVRWPGLITRFFSVAPADAHELSVVPEPVESTYGLLVDNNRNYHSPKTKEQLPKSMGVELLAP